MGVVNRNFYANIMNDKSQNVAEMKTTQSFKICTASSGPILWWLRLTGFKGIALFWNVAYVVPGEETNERLIKHQLEHLEQMKRDLWWSLKYGYRNNPYEVKAREAEN